MVSPDSETSQVSGAISVTEEQQQQPQKRDQQLALRPSSSHSARSSAEGFSWFLLSSVNAQRDLACHLSPQTSNVLSSLMHLSLRSALAAERKYRLIAGPQRVGSITGAAGGGGGATTTQASPRPTLEAKGLPALPGPPLPTSTIPSLAPSLSSASSMEPLQSPAVNRVRYGALKRHQHNNSAPDLSIATRAASEPPPILPDMTAPLQDSSQATGGQRYALDCINMGVFTAIGQRSSMEDFAFAMPLNRPDDSWFRMGACFGVFDGHGGDEVARSLATHIPGSIVDNLHNIARSGPQHVGELLSAHERRLRNETNMWTHKYQRVTSHSIGLQSMASEGSNVGLRRSPYSAHSLGGAAPWGGGSTTDSPKFSPLRPPPPPRSAFSMTVHESDVQAVRGKLNSEPSWPPGQPANAAGAAAGAQASSSGGGAAAHDGEPSAVQGSGGGKPSPVLQRLDLGLVQSESCGSGANTPGQTPTATSYHSTPARYSTDHGHSHLGRPPLPPSHSVTHQHAPPLLPLPQTTSPSTTTSAAHHVTFQSPPTPTLTAAATAAAAGPAAAGASQQMGGSSSSSCFLDMRSQSEVCLTLQGPNPAPRPASSSIAGSTTSSNGTGAGPSSGPEEQLTHEEWEEMMEGRDPGSTALVATIIDNSMHVANVGDCRLILAELIPGSSKVQARSITMDHVPDKHEGEAERLRRIGVPVNEGYVADMLQVSRSIGDFSTKFQLGSRAGEEVILSDPELHTVHLGPTALFAVAASDGITGYMSDEAIIEQVCRYLNEDGPTGLGNNPQHAAEQLVKYAINARDSADNASVVVACFKSSKPPPPERPRNRFFRTRRDSSPLVVS